MSSKSSQRSSQKVTGDNIMWSNGSIKSITLENFMCHSNFHLTFNPKINFISGLNGSGKSAIQTAIVIGFGARASITSRASTLKSLIKYGCSSATISITISNEDEYYNNETYSQFKPEVYGKQITLVRQINEMSTTFKFLNENGRVVKSLRNELKNLILHFNIVVENPICIMNQAMVKTFHKSANPEDKYDLFYRAISANIYHDSIEETELIGKQYSEKLHDIKNVMNQCFKDLQDIEIYEKKSLKLTALEQKVLILQNEYTWFLVIKCEKNYEEYLNKIEECKNYISQSVNKIEVLEENIKNYSETLTIKNMELKNVEESRGNNHFILMKRQKKLQDKSNEHDHATKAFKKHDSNINSLINSKNDILNHIEIERQKGNINTLAQYEEMIARYKEKISEIDAALKTNVEHEQILQNTVDDFKQRMGNLKNNEVTRIEKRVVELSRNINYMSQQQDKINVYGNWMPALLQSIENACKQNKFIKKPIGPIGTHIKVNNDKWMFSIENHLGRGFLRTFLVDNFDDNNVLQSIMDQILPRNMRKPTVIVSKYFDRIHNIESRETKNSMFRMLTFTSAVVANCLIDNHSIETIMLVENNEEAMNLMENSSRIPRNCHFSLTLDGTQVYPSPAYRIYSLQNPSDAVLLQSDVSVAVNNLKQEKMKLEMKIKSLNNEFEQLENSKSKKQQLLDQTRMETSSIKTKYDNYLNKMNQLKAKCEEHQDDRMDYLTKELDEVDQKIALAIKTKENAKEPIYKLESEIEVLKGKLCDIKSVIDSTDRSAMIDQIEILNGKIDGYNNEMIQIKNDLINMKNKLKDLDHQANNEKKNIEQETKIAENICHRVEVTRSEEDIKKDTEEAKRNCMLLKMELDKRKPCNFILKNEFLSKKKEYFEHTILYKKVVKIYLDNKNAVELSRVALGQYIGYINLKVVEAFDLILSFRNMKGKVSITPEEKSIIITMFDNISTSCASGGERTFATVAFIMSLWNNMKLPFYSIDEYDVYMDSINRVATTQLVMVSIEQLNSQFIFLTPQDISHIKSSEHVKIVKLKEPRT